LRGTERLAEDTTDYGAQSKPFPITEGASREFGRNIIQYSPRLTHKPSESIPTPPNEKGVGGEKFLFLGTRGGILRGQFREKFVLNFKATRSIFLKVFGGELYLSNRRERRKKKRNVG
jgi:hypothetical protein